MDVVGEDAEGVENDTVALGCDGEDVAEDLVHRLGGPEEEPPLRAAASEKVLGAWNDATRSGHSPRKGTDRAMPRVERCRGVTEGPRSGRVRAADRGPWKLLSVGVHGRGSHGPCHASGRAVSRGYSR